MKGKQFCPNCGSEEVRVYEEDSRIECSDCDYKGKMVIIPKAGVVEDEPDEEDEEEVKPKNGGRRNGR